VKYIVAVFVAFWMLLIVAGFVREYLIRQAMYQHF